MDESWGSQVLSVIPAKHFSTFQKFPKISKILFFFKKLKKIKFALISEMVRDRAKRGYCMQNYKFLICCFLIG